MKHVILAALAAALVPTTAFAHGGHGDAKWVDTVLHYLIEPIHWPQVLAVVVTLAVVSRAKRKVSR